MNLVKAFVDYLQGQHVATWEQDMFISRAPSSNKVPNRIFWLKAAGGGQEGRSLNGGSRQQHVIEIYHRDTSSEGVYDTLQELGDNLACSGCVTLEGYDVLGVETNGPWTDQDLDNEERTVGLLQVLITIRKEC